MMTAVMPAMMTWPVMMVAVMELRPMMPSVMARSGEAVSARAPRAAAPAITDLAHLIDVGRFACDVAGQRKPVRHRGGGAGHQGCASQRGQSNHGKLDIHRDLLG